MGPPPKEPFRALGQVARLGNKRLRLAFLDAGARVKSSEHAAVKNSTPVHEALRGPSRELALLLLDHVYDSVCDDPRDGESVYRAELRWCRSWLRETSRGCTPLHVAAE